MWCISKEERHRLALQKLARVFKGHAPSARSDANNIAEVLTLREVEIRIVMRLFFLAAGRILPYV